MPQDRNPTGPEHPNFASCANPAHVSADIDAAFHHARAGASTIEVTAKGGVVTLTGTVRTEDQRVLAGDAAARSPGTTGVENQLRII